MSEKKKLSAGQVLFKNGYLVLDKSVVGNVTIELIAGFMPKKIPQAVKNAAAIIIRHWLANPSDFNDRIYREPDALQLLQLHTSGMAWPDHAMEGGSLWQ